MMIPIPNLDDPMYESPADAQGFSREDTERLGRLLVKVKHLDEEVRTMMVPGAARGGEGGSGGKAGSKPPVPVHLLDIVLESYNITRGWAANLMADTWGEEVRGVSTCAWVEGRSSTAGWYCDWLFRHRTAVAHMDWASDMLDELERLFVRMEAVVKPVPEPEPVRSVPAEVRDRLVTAREAARLTHVKENTIRQWGSRGSVPTVGKPRLYRIGDVLDHFNGIVRPS